MMFDLAAIEIDFMLHVADGIRWACATALFITLILTARLSYQRLVHKAKWQLGLVWLCNLLLVISLVLLISDVRVQKSQVLTSVLITSNADLAAVDTYLDGSNSSTRYFVLANSLQTNNENGIAEIDIRDHWQIIQHPEQIMTQPIATQKLIIAGDGLSEDQFTHMQVIANTNYALTPQIVFLPSVVRSGLIDMRWQKQLVTGQQQQISGRLQWPNASAKIIQLQLLDPAGAIINSARLRHTESFSFVFPAKAQGNWLYRLRLVDIENNQTLATNPLAMQVNKPLRRHILILQSAPSFETKKIKNWAADSGAATTMLTQISQTRFIAQYSNQNDQLADSSATVVPILAWDDYDMAILDGRALLNLTVVQGQQLRAAVELGLGLLIIADTQLVNSANSQVLSELTQITLSPWDDISSHSQSSSMPAWPGMQAEQAIPSLSARLVFNQQNRVKSKHVEVVVTDQSGRSLLAVESVDLGKVAVSLVNASYQWQLSGQSTEYSHYWQTLLAKIAKYPTTPYWLAQSVTGLAKLQQPVEVCAMVDEQQSMQASLSANNMAKMELALWPDTMDPHKVCGRIWPQQEAWQELLLIQGETADYQHIYAYSDQDWLTWQQSLTHAASINAANQSAIASAGLATTAVVKWPFWLLLIFSASILWIERKFFSG